MPSPVRVLLLATTPAEVESVLDDLRRGGFEPRCEPVATEAEALASLHSHTLDLPVVVVRARSTHTLAQLAAGVAHDLRNVVILPLVLQVELAERALRQGDLDRARELITDIADTARHGEAAVDRLRHAGRQLGDVELRRQVVSPDELAQRAADIARAHLRRTGSSPATSVIVISGATAPIDVDPHEVIAALVNVLVNAIDVVADTGGNVRIRSGTDQRGGWFEITDDGPGITPEVRARMFDPFFTTKGDDGTGVGLGLVEACMRRHGGSIDLDTAPNFGTRFRLRFPATPER